MEKQNPTGLPPTQEGSGPGAASRVPDDGKWLEEGKIERLASEAQRWNAQWLKLLERMWTPVKLDEAALFREAKVLLNEHTERIISVLPPDLQVWLKEHRMLNTCYALQLAEAVFYRLQEPWSRMNQCVAPAMWRVEKQNPAALPPTQEGPGSGPGPGPGAAYCVLEDDNWPEERRINGSPSEAQRWKARWLNLLERMWTPVKMDEAALLREARALLSHYAERTLSVLPRHMRAWLKEHRMLGSPKAVQLAEAFAVRLRQPCNRENQGAAGSSSATVQPNPPDVQQEEDGKPSILAGHKPESDQESGQPGTSSESPRGQEGNATEDKVDPSMPGLGGAVQEEERQMGDSVLVSPSSLTAEEELTNPSLLQKTFSQISISEAPSAEEKL